jgi:AcrR family transcriptional regulator
MSPRTSIGRPRDTAIDAAVLDATRALLLEVGYQDLTFALVAERAGSSRPTLYRRWPSRAHLVHDAVFTRGAEQLAATGSFATDLRQIVRRTLRSYARPEARAALPGLLAELRDPALRRSVIDPLQQPVRARFAELVAAAQARGEVRPGIDPDTLLDTVVGATMHHALAEATAGRTFADGLTDLLLAAVQTDAGRCGCQQAATRRE